MNCLQHTFLSVHCRGIGVLLLIERQGKGVLLCKDSKTDVIQCVNKIFFSKKKSFPLATNFSACANIFRFTLRFIQITLRDDF